MLATSILATLALTLPADAGIIMGNLVPSADIIHMSTATPLDPQDAQVVEAVTLESCDETVTWSAPMAGPVFITDFLAIVAPNEDWCTVTYDLGPVNKVVDLTEDGDYLVGDFSTPDADWDVTFGNGFDILGL